MLLKYIILITFVPKNIFGNEEVTKECIETHNKYREQHGVPPLGNPSKEMQDYADKRAEELASTDEFEHPSNPTYGENLFYGFGDSFTCSNGVDPWYGEIEMYDFKNGGFDAATGHFTQVIWKDTTEVACATSKSKTKEDTTYVIVS